MRTVARVKLLADCACFASRALQMKPARIDAARGFAYVACSAGSETEAESPVDPYTQMLRDALFAMYGHPDELAALPAGQQEEAITAWLWFEDTTGAELDAGTTVSPLRDAVAEMRLKGQGWRERMRAALRAGAGRTND